MNRSKLGVAIVAALAVLMIGAASAQAVSFKAAEYPALASGEQVEGSSLNFEFEGGQEAECAVAGFGGFLEEATSSFALSPGFGGCTAFGEKGEIESNSCEFIFHPGTGSGDAFTGTFDISCPTGQKIVFTGHNCEIQVSSQSGLGPVEYDNATAASPDNVEATFAMESAAGFGYTTTADGSGCPLSGTGAKTGGVLTGTAKLQAGSFETLEPIALIIS